MKLGLQGKKFSERKGLIVKLLHESDLGEELRDRAIELWKETTEIMQVRNLLAHNPINSVEIDGANKTLGVVDMRASIANEYHIARCYQDRERRKSGQWARP